MMFGFWDLSFAFVGRFGLNSLHSYMCGSKGSQEKA